MFLRKDRLAPVACSDALECYGGALLHGHREEFVQHVRVRGMRGGLSASWTTPLHPVLWLVSLTHLCRADCLLAPAGTRARQ